MAPMPLDPGTRLGRYEVRELLGAGGMGEVYRAHDAKLDRDVAVKVLPAAFAEDASAVERFQREARAVATLEHPNILAIHDFGSDDGHTWAAMELLRGSTLRERLAEGPIPTRKAVELARQLAEGLGAAHDAGIVHRDVKPENVFIQDDDRLKVLDFGLAGRQTPATTDGYDTAAPTQKQLTEPGTVMGTVGYMSPEQVRGEVIDHRSDIFSFGCVLYEMLTGQRTFHRANRAEMMIAVLRDEPADLAKSASFVIPALRQIVYRCLEKSPAKRFQSANDLAFAIANAAPSGAVTATAEPVTPEDDGPGRHVTPVAVGVVVIIGIVIGFLFGRTSAPVTSGGSSLGGTLQQLTFDAPGSDQPSIAGDGKTVVYVREGDIFLQRVGGENAINLTPDSPALDYHPAYSPDGERIAFRSERGGGGIFVMGATGEAVRRVADFGYNPAWSPDGKHLVVATEAVPGLRSTSRLWRLDVATGKSFRLTEFDGVQPDWSPNGERIVFRGFHGSVEEPDVGAHVIQTIPAEGGEPTVLVKDGAVNWSPRWTPDGGAVVFCSTRSGVPNLWRLPVDETTGRATGEAVPITLSERSHAFVSIARDGTIAFAVSRRDWVAEGASFDLATLAVGEVSTVYRTTRYIQPTDISASGDWTLLSIADNQNIEVLIMRMDGTRRFRLTNDPAFDGNATFGPGDDVYFNSRRSGRWGTWRIRRDGSGLTRLPLKEAITYPSVSPDGRWLAGSTPNGAVVIDLEQPAAVRRIPLLEGRNMQILRWSPDGKQLVGSASAESAATGILLYTLETNEVKLLRETGFLAHFLPDGRVVVREGFFGGAAFVLDPATGTETPLELGPLARSDIIFVSPGGRSIGALTIIDQTEVWVLHPEASE